MHHIVMPVLILGPGTAAQSYQVGLALVDGRLHRKKGATPVRNEIAVQAPPPAELRACPGRNASSAVPAPDAFEKAPTPSSKRRLCSTARLHHMRFIQHHVTSLHHESTCTILATSLVSYNIMTSGSWSNAQGP